MEIIKSLGVDSTLWVQLVCFLVSYLALSNFLFKPYMRALEERQKRTVGGEELAARLSGEASELHGEYEQKARALNAQIKGFYDQSRTEATKEFETIVKTARDESGSLVQSAREKISTEVQKARVGLSAEVPAVSTAIASKLAGKEL